VNIADNFGIVDGVVVVNRLMQRWFAEHLGAQSPARIHYIRHGVKPATQLHVPDPSRPLRVALIGRLEPAIKRVLDVIPMVRELERLQTAFELHVYGDGPSESELRVALEGNGVFFHGYATQERLYAEAYPAIDAVLLFSTEEGTPNVICEAMQHAVVPVTSRYRGQAGEGFVIDGVTGLTFPVGDATTAAQRIHALAGDRELLGRLSHAAHEVVRGDSDTRMHRDWLTVFETTLALPPRNEPPAAVRVASSAGRLDRIAGPSIADRLRVVLRGGAKHPDGWSEWPGTMPVARERAEKVVCELEEIDRAQR
jgi:glycosyltransferase involved in cell wall biosynthesis